MADIKFSKEEKDEITKKIYIYFQEELDQELGRFDAEFLLDFFTKEIGPYFYNRGLYDAQAILAKRADDLAEAILALEKPTQR